MKTPSNRPPHVFTAEEIARIGKVGEKHDLWIVSDEVYATITYGKPSSPRLRCGGTGEEHGRVSSLSQIHAMLWIRLGWDRAARNL